MNKELMHVLIAEVADAAIEIEKIMKTDKLSYNRRICRLAISIYFKAKQMHNEIFPACTEDNEDEDEDEDEDLEIPF